MDTTIKVWLIVAAVLVILGALIFVAVMSINHWDFNKLSTVKYVTNTHRVQETFSSIALTTDTADIVFVPSEDAVSRVICHEQVNSMHSVTVKDGCLNIQVKDARKWHDHIGINIRSAKVTVSLPREAYESLVVKGSTGNVELTDHFSFETADISISTGNIHAENLSAGDLSLKVSTGGITAANINCTGILTVQTSTGRANLAHISCGTLTSTGSTGDVKLENVVAARELSILRSTGDVKLIKCDAQELNITTDTGDVTGTLLTDKVFTTQTSTGRVRVPQTTTGGKCQITTSTGNIEINIEE